MEREGVTLLCGAPAVVAMILDAAAARAGAGPRRARAGHGADRGRRRTAPTTHDRARRVRARLGVRPDLRADRDVPPAHDQPRAEGVGRRSSRRSAPRCSAVPASPPSASRSPSTSTGRSWRGRTTSSRATGTSPIETEKALEGGWFHTGDGGYLDGPYTVITDRRKDVIITGGENVSSIEVEDCLFQHPAVAEVAVIGVPDETWGESVKALVVLREGHAATEAELIAHCRTVARALQGAASRSSSATSSPGPPRASSRSSSSASPTGRASTAR